MNLRTIIAQQWATAITIYSGFYNFVVEMQGTAEQAEDFAVSHFGELPLTQRLADLPCAFDLVN
jgi:hypothetical protein